MSSIKTNIILSSTAQSQLNQLKAANAYGVDKLKSIKAGFDSKDKAVEALDASATAVKDAISTLRKAETPAEKVAASKDLVAKYNALMTSVTNSTAKGATLGSTFELRSAKSTLRESFLSNDVIAGLSAGGVTTTRAGLQMSSLGSGEISAAALDSISASIGKFTKVLDSLETNLETKSASTSVRITQEQSRVDRKNVVTENNFIKMYQVMQQMSSGSASSVSSILGG